MEDDLIDYEMLKKIFFSIMVNIKLYKNIKKIKFCQNTNKFLKYNINYNSINNSIN